SRLEAGTLKPTYDWFDLNELIFHVIKDVGDPISQNRISFEYNDNLAILYIDGGFLETILHNLIHNALQHTPKNTTILIDTKHNNGILVIEISDNGPGFPKEEINFVFDKFYKLNGTATGGTGLGL